MNGVDARKEKIMDRLKNKLGEDLSLEEEKNLDTFPGLKKIFYEFVQRDLTKQFRSSDILEKKNHALKMQLFWNHLKNNINEDDFFNSITKNDKTFDEKMRQAKMGDVLKGDKNDFIKKISQRKSLFMICDSALEKIDDMIKKYD